MTDEEFTSLLRHTDGCFRRVLWFLRLTGCRPGEMSRLTWDNVDLQRCVCTLHQHKTVLKTGRPRLIILCPTALRMLLWMRRQAEGAEGLVFKTRRGTRWVQGNLSLRVQRLRKRAGLPKSVRLYGLRHRFGTDGVRNGVNLKILSDIMGHANINMTLHYVHIAGNTELLREAVEQVVRPVQKVRRASA
jgi:integrase